MSGIIFVRGLHLRARHGDPGHGADCGQRFAIDLELRAHIEQAANSDRLSDTIDYAAIVATVTAAFAGSPPLPLARAAEAVAQAILRVHQSVSSARVSIHTPHGSVPAVFDNVGVTIVRDRSL
jgi:dihydroneopterin aldolase